MIHIHAIATGISESEKQKIDAFVISAGSCIQYYSIQDPNIDDFITMSTWTSAVYYRLYFPLLIGDDKIERILYLDTDMIVLRDLSELFTMPLDGYPIAAVYDNYVVIQPLIGIPTPGEYFNSGMLLIDIRAWNDQKISERTMDYLRQYPDRIRYVDQCGLNAVLYKNWKKIDKKFNLLYTYIPEDASRRELDRLQHQSIILHFTLQRPWHMLCKNRFRKLYRHYLKSSLLFQGKIISDFSFGKVHSWLFIRILEFYHDSPRIKRTWQIIKNGQL